MNQDERDALAEEQGYVICPISTFTYVACNADCANCADYKAFVAEINQEVPHD